MHRLLEDVFAQRMRYLVLGDIMIDRYISGSIKRISPEAPVPVLTVEDRTAMPGGAGNVAVNLAGLNAEVSLIGFTGADESENQLNSLLTAKNIILKTIHWAKGTVSKTRIVAGRQQLVRIDDESLTAPSQEEYAALEKLIESHDFEGLHGAIISDYNKGTCASNLCSILIEKCKTQHIPLVIDPKGEDWDKYKGAALLTPNLKELGDALGRSIPNEDAAVEQAGVEALARYGVDNLVLTRSEHGMTLISREGCYHFPTAAREICDVSGAGDTAAACLLRFMSSSMSVMEAIPLANMAAGIVVSYAGTHPIDMNLMLAESRKHSSLSPEHARRSGKTIVFTNGCFDILHPGHIDYLSRARALGDYLIVGLNTDASVKRLKGRSRPVNNQQIRKTMLEALACVNKVILFDEDTPLELVHSIQPDILVKGGDYRKEDVIGREYAAKTIILPFLDGHSTTEFLDRIRQSHG